MSEESFVNVEKVNKLVNSFIDVAIKENANLIDVAQAAKSVNLAAMVKISENLEQRLDVITDGIELKDLKQKASISKSKNKKESV